MIISLVTSGPNPGGLGGDIQLRYPGRWVRFALYLDRCPFARRGYWRTSYGRLHGVNLRIGPRVPMRKILRHLGQGTTYRDPYCLTTFIHTHRETGRSWEGLE